MKLKSDAGDKGSEQPPGPSAHPVPLQPSPEDREGPSSPRVPCPRLSGPVTAEGAEEACVPGDLISRLYLGHHHGQRPGLPQNINIFLRNTVKVTGGVVVFMFSLSWQLSLVTFMGFPIIMMVSDIYGKYYKVGPA